MVEQANACECHYDSVLVAGFDYIVVAYAATRLSDDRDAALVRSLDVVAEGEECVASERDIGVLVEPFALFFTGEHGGLFGENRLPFAFRQDILVFVTDVDIDCVVTVGAFDSIDELQAEHFR